MLFPLYVIDNTPGLRHPWALLLLILVNIAVYFLAIEIAESQGSEAITKIYASIGDESLTFRHLILSSFLHADLVHLLSNMWFLWLFAKPLVTTLPALVFFAIYLAANVCGTFLQDLLTDGGSIGSSASVAGMMGFFMLNFMDRKIRCLLLIIPIALPAWLLVGFFIGRDMYGIYTNEGYVAYWAHLGGCATGVLCALAVNMYDNRVIRRSTR